MARAEFACFVRGSFARRNYLQIRAPVPLPDSCHSFHGRLDNTFPVASKTLLNALSFNAPMLISAFSFLS